MHNKFFVIDGQIVWSGSTNMTDTGFTYNHNNSLVFTSTELAAIYHTEFDEMFVAGLFGTAKTDNTTHTLTYAGAPLEIYFSPSDGAMAQVISEVAAADESIYFSIFFFTDDALRDALIARKQAGVTISGIFDLLGAGNQFSEDEVLCQAGIPIKVEHFGGRCTTSL
jgi:phosphatidylserine/phosphatidylglycerophosphate/cardiolipin synthase-like enzyme